MNVILTLGSFVFFTALVAAINLWISRGVDSGSNDGLFLAVRSLTFPFLAASLLLTNSSTAVSTSGRSDPDGRNIHTHCSIPS